LIIKEVHQRASTPQNIDLRLSAAGNQVFSESFRLPNVGSWTHVEIPLTGFYQSASVPDTLSLKVQAGSLPNGQSEKGVVFHLDDVHFGYHVSGGNPPAVYTMGHDPLGSHNFNLYGAINTNGDGRHLFICLFN